MGNIDVSATEGGATKKHRGVKMAKRLSTRIDMTPMVDLGFLLITFFIFTATMIMPSTIDLTVPKDVADPAQLTAVPVTGVLTILLDKGNKVYYFEGQLKVSNGVSNLKQSDFMDIRNVIIRKKGSVISMHKHDRFCQAIQKEAKKRNELEDWGNACLDKNFVVFIKPGKESTYRNTVDIFDEMTINEVKTFALVKIEDLESRLMGEWGRSFGEKTSGK